MSLDRLEAMRVFCRIVEMGSFTAAAESLQVPKTTVSGQIQALESLLGIKLLHRTTRKVSPSTEGSAYYLRARAVIDEVDELEASVSRSRNIVRGRVQVEVPSPVGILFLVPAISLFAEKFPAINLDIGCSERAVDLVVEGVDCAIRGGAVSNPDLICRPIGKMQFCLCASAVYIANAPSINVPSDLSSHRHLGFKFPATNRRYIPKFWRDDHSFMLSDVPSMYFNNGQAKTAAVLAGLGIAFIPRAEALPHLQAGSLIEILPEWQMESMPLSLVYPNTRHTPARVRAFTGWVSELMSNDPMWSLSDIC